MAFDAVIVGARCAGAAAALLLARAGARVLVVDKGAYGADTLSTHALMRGAVVQLHRWGVLPAIVAAGTPPVTRTTFTYGDVDVDVHIESRYGVSALYAPRRSLLDRAIVDAAVASGVEFRYGARVDALSVDDDGRVRGVSASYGGVRHRIDAGLVIGADGMYSTVARAVGAATRVEGSHAAAVLYAYWTGLPSDAYHWQFQPTGSIGIIPTNAGAACVFAAVSAARFRDEVGGGVDPVYRRWIRETWPSFSRQLETAEQVEPVRGFGGLRGFIRRSVGPGWALVGDAGYFKDPATAHGITDALRDAELLARAVVAGTSDALAGYERTRDELSRAMFDITDEIASFPSSEERLQQLHRALSGEMSREVKMLAGLEPIGKQVLEVL
jgi:2-polyprenyl-6-methoxyphenol hydroxylase-like FAD-dependent oxidoreductase